MKISFTSYRREGVVNSLTERGKRANSEPNKWKTQRNLSGQKLLLPETLHVTLNSHSGRVGANKGRPVTIAFPIPLAQEGVWTRSSLSWSGVGMGMMRCNPVRTIEYSLRRCNRIRTRTCLVYTRIGHLKHLMWANIYLY